MGKQIIAKKPFPLKDYAYARSMKRVGVVLGFFLIGSLLVFGAAWGIVAAVRHIDATSAERVQWLMILVCTVGGAGDAWWAFRERPLWFRIGTAFVTAVCLCAASYFGAQLGR